MAMEAYSPPNGVDVRVLHQAFGPDADLYTDVLRVPSVSSRDDLRAAFFQRRSELFSQLAKMEQDDDIGMSQRMYAERRMDAVVMAFRVLDDPESREQYDQARHQRLQRRTTAGEVSYEQTQPGQGAFSLVTPSPERKARRKKTDRQYSMAGEDIEMDSSLETSRGSEAVDMARSWGTSRTERNTPTTEEETPDEDADMEAWSSKPRRSPRLEGARVSHKEGRYSRSRRSPKPDEVAQLADKVVRSGKSRRTYTFSDEAGLALARPSKSRRSPTYDEEAGDEKAVRVSSSRRSRRSSDETSRGTERTSRSKRASTRETTTLSKRYSHSAVMDAVHEEVHGSLQDTVSACDQVLNAFSLSDGDIDAVVGRIDKAKRQFNRAI